jgi:thymidine kinase
MAKLHFYYSAMNAGKTTTLLQSSYNYREKGMNTILFTPSIDDRYAVGTITSRIGLSSKAHPFDQKFNFYEFLVEQLNDPSFKVHCVLIDEAQFLTKAQVYQLTDITVHLNLPVLTYGLRSDFLGEPFEGSKYLLTIAEDIKEIKTICHCGRKATMNARVDEAGNMVTQGKQIEIGGNDRYIALCQRHFKLGQALPGLED